MNKLLLIIDPQIDFISGALPVPGAESAMNSLAGYILTHGNRYDRIIVTADRHPMDHCSFVDKGGKWPRHCVADSVGAAIWPPIMDALYWHSEKVTVLHKGEDAGKEEYSIFKNAQASENIRHLLNERDIKEIDICGLAGDVCVADTIRDGVRLPDRPAFNVLTPYTPSLDGGYGLDSLIKSGLATEIAYDTQQ